MQQKRDLASLGSKELVQWRQRRGPGGVVPGTEPGPKASVTSPEGGRPLAPGASPGPHAHPILDCPAKGAFFVVPVEGEPTARGACHLPACLA